MPSALPGSLKGFATPGDLLVRTEIIDPDELVHHFARLPLRIFSLQVGCDPFRNLYDFLDFRLIPGFKHSLLRGVNAEPSLGLRGISPFSDGSVVLFIRPACGRKYPDSNWEFFHCKEKVLS